MVPHKCSQTQEVVAKLVARVQCMCTSCMQSLAPLLIDQWPGPCQASLKPCIKCLNEDLQIDDTDAVIPDDLSLVQDNLKRPIVMAL